MFPDSFDQSLEEFFGFMECSQIGLLKEKTNLTKAIEWTSKKTYLVACLDHTGATEGASLITGMEYGMERWNGKWNGTVNVHSCS